MYKATLCAGAGWRRRVCKCAGRRKCCAALATLLTLPPPLPSPEASLAGVLELSDQVSAAACQAAGLAPRPGQRAGNATTTTPPARPAEDEAQQELLLAAQGSSQFPLRLVGRK